MLTMALAFSLGNVRLRTLLALLAGLAPAFAPAFGQETLTARWEGRPISRIEFDPPLPPEMREEFNRILPFKPGDLVRLDAMREAIRKLYATGRFGDISIDASPEGSGAVLRISAEFNYFISGVNISGENEPPNRDQLVTAAKLELG